jgi:hypothetical protein
MVRLLYFLLAVLSIPVLYLTAGAFWPALVPAMMRLAVGNQRLSLLLITLATLIGFICFVYGKRNVAARAYGLRCLGLCLGLAGNLVLTGTVMTGISLTRTAKHLAEKSLPFIGAQDQIVFYNIALQGLPFYLSISRPAWLVSSGTRSHVIGSFYIAEFWHRLATDPGEQLLTYEQFAKRWKETNQRLVMFIDEKQLADLATRLGDSPKELATIHSGKDNYVLLANR